MKRNWNPRTQAKCDLAWLAELLNVDCLVDDLLLSRSPQQSALAIVREGRQLPRSRNAKAAQKQRQVIAAILDCPAQWQQIIAEEAYGRAA